jgi:hypothetical protein
MLGWPGPLKALFDLSIRTFRSPVLIPRPPCPYHASTHWHCGSWWQAMFSSRGMLQPVRDLPVWRFRMVPAVLSLVPSLCGRRVPLPFAVNAPLLLLFARGDHDMWRSPRTRFHECLCLSRAGTGGAGAQPSFAQKGASVRMAPARMCLSRLRQPRSLPQ